MKLRCHEDRSESNKQLEKLIFLFDETRVGVDLEANNSHGIGSLSHYWRELMLGDTMIIMMGGKVYHHHGVVMIARTLMHTSRTVRIKRDCFCTKQLRLRDYFDYIQSRHLLCSTVSIIVQ